QLVFGRCLHRKIARLLTAQNAIDIGCGSAVAHLRRFSSVGNQTAVCCERAVGVDRRKAVLGRYSDDPLTMKPRKGVWHHDEPVIRLPREDSQSAVDLRLVANGG